MELNEFLRFVADSLAHWIWQDELFQDCLDGFLEPVDDLLAMQAEQDALMKGFVDDFLLHFDVL
jgi:hypothetical protein